MSMIVFCLPLKTINIKYFFQKLQDKAYLNELNLKPLKFQAHANVLGLEMTSQV